jgi:hypothetical protein
MAKKSKVVREFHLQKESAKALCFKKRIKSNYQES